jgi:heme-degrading monooxygenase HmoA
MWITVATPPFDSIEKFDEVRAQIGTEPAGLQARYVGRADDGKLRSITVWRSKEDSDRFFTETLRPALAKVLGSEAVGRPEMVGVEVERTYVREPVA